MKRAIFLDRDGTINKLIFNQELNEFGPPHLPEEFELIDGAINAIQSFMESGYSLFVVSNQPDHAKGKASLSDLLSVHAEFEKQMNRNGLRISAFYYCYHHPEGIVPEYSFDCECRKPKPYFVLKAINEYKIDKSHSWFIGDRGTDIACGKLAGLRTAFLTSGQGSANDDMREDITAKDLKSASELILKHNLMDYAISK